MATETKMEEQIQLNSTTKQNQTPSTTKETDEPSKCVIFQDPDDPVIPLNVRVEGTVQYSRVDIPQFQLILVLALTV